MWRYLAGGLGTLVLVGAGLFLWGSRPDTPSPLHAASAATASPPQTAEDDAPLPEASAKTREQKRFDRYDKDRNGAITREEYLAARRKAYAKLAATATASCRSTNGRSRPRPSSPTPTATDRAR